MSPSLSRFPTVCLAMLLALLALAGMLAFLRPPAHVAALPTTTFVVTNLNDSGPGSLRQAILDANATAGADLIQITAVGVIYLLAPLPVINEAVTIQGPGAGQLAVDGGHNWRVFDIAAVPVTVAGLTIQHSSPSAGEGGGLRSLGALTLRHVDVLSNTAPIGGGGVYISNTVEIEGGRFENNRSLGSTGGGLMATGRAVISGTRFISNTAVAQGGGAALTGGSHVSHGRFEQNRSLNANGGGVYAANAVTLTNMLFLENIAQTDGGGMLAFGQAEVYGSHFIANQSNNRGGALYVGSFLTVAHSAFIGNSGGRGGAIYHGVFTGWLENSLFAGNSASVAGAQLYLNGVATVALRHLTAVGSSGTAVHVVNSNVTVSNTIIAGHTAGIDNVNGTVSQDYNLFFDNGADTQGLVSGGAHNASGDPRFIDPAQDNYHLGAGSAAIDTGTDAGILTDYDGETRPSGAGFDIGFDEANYIAGLAFTFTPSPTTTVAVPATFTATVTHGTGINYQWDFGDGTAVTSGNPISHTFTTAGAFPVTLTASNSAGSVSITMPIDVHPLPRQLYLPLVSKE